MQEIGRNEYKRNILRYMKEQNREDKGIRGTVECKKSGGMNTKKTFS